MPAPGVIWLFIAALAASVVTLVVASLLIHFWILPHIERHIDEKVDQAARGLEERIRGRFVEMLGGKSGELIRERARDLARTGMGLLASRRPQTGRADEDDDFPS